MEVTELPAAWDSGGRGSKMSALDHGVASIPLIWELFLASISAIKKRSMCIIVRIETVVFAILAADSDRTKRTVSHFRLGVR